MDVDITGLTELVKPCRSREAGKAVTVAAAVNHACPDDLRCKFTLTSKSGLLALKPTRVCRALMWPSCCYFIGLFFFSSSIYPEMTFAEHVLFHHAMLQAHSVGPCVYTWELPRTVCYCRLRRQFSRWAGWGMTRGKNIP